MDPTPTNACTSCRQRKRRCDRALPTCGTCIRTVRTCIYDENPTWDELPGGSGFDGVATYLEPQRPRPAFSPASSSIDPFRHESLRQSTVDVIIHEEALKVFGSKDRVRGVVDQYFRSVHHRLTILSRRRFLDRIPAVMTETASAEYMALCMCMLLILEKPGNPAETMQSSLYVTVKSVMSILTASGAKSLDTIQCWVIIAFYELGHAIHPACSMSLATCAQLARCAGLHRSHRRLPENQTLEIELEEQKRVWWIIVNLERFQNLCDGDALFGTEDPKSGTLLPIEDSNWTKDIIPHTHDVILATPSDITVGQLARECQVCHLVGRVVRHVFDPTSDQTFQNEEAMQLETTLMAFMPLLIEEETQYSKYCAALGMCSSALFTLYEVTPIHSLDEQHESSQKLAAMEPLSNQIASFSGQLFGNEDAVDFETLSPLVTYSLYQAAVVQHRLWKKTNDQRYKNNLDNLSRILGLFNRRWLVAGRYLRSLDVDQPKMMVPSMGHCISA